MWGRNLLICRQKGDDKKHELYCHTSCDPESVFPLKSLAELPCFPLRRMFVFPINSIPSRMVSSCWLCIRKEPYHHFISSHHHPTRLWIFLPFFSSIQADSGVTSIVGLPYYFSPFLCALFLTTLRDYSQHNVRYSEEEERQSTDRQTLENYDEDNAKKSWRPEEKRHQPRIQLETITSTINTGASTSVSNLGELIWKESSASSNGSFILWLGQTVQFLF